MVRVFGLLFLLAAGLVVFADSAAQLYNFVTWQATKAHENARLRPVALRAEDFSPERAVMQLLANESQTVYWVIEDPNGRRRQIVEAYTIAPVTLRPTQDEPRNPFVTDEYAAFARNQTALQDRLDGVSRPCPDQAVVNLRVYYHVDGTHADMFDAPHLILQHTVFEQRREAARNMVLMDVVTEDTDGDGHLSCNDLPRLIAFDLDRRRAAEIALENEFPATRRPRWGAAQMMLGLGADANGDGAFDETREPIRIGFFNEDALRIDEAPKRVEVEAETKKTEAPAGDPSKAENAPKNVGLK